MKFLKKFESIDDTVWILVCKDVYDGDEESFISFTDVFRSEEDLDNYVIIYWNHMQDSVVNNDSYDEDIREKINDYILDDYEKCVHFMYDMYDICDFDLDPEMWKNKKDINSNIQLNDVLKMKLSSKKFNL